MVFAEWVATQRTHRELHRHRPPHRWSHPGAKAAARRTLGRTGAVHVVRLQPHPGARGA